MAILCKAKANFANTWEFEVVEQIVAFQGKCLSLDKKKSPSFLAQYQKN